jgi:excisionase family DNA binding protein
MDKDPVAAKSTTNVPKLIDVKTLSERIGVKVKTIYAWVHEGHIPCRKLRHLVRFDEEEITKWLEGKEYTKHEGNPSI